MAKLMILTNGSGILAAPNRHRLMHLNYMKLVLPPVLCIILSLFVLNSCVRTLAFSENKVERLAKIKKVGILISISSDELKTYDIADIRHSAYAPIAQSGQKIEPLAVVAGIIVAEIIS